MATLEKRIEALETKAGGMDESALLIVRGVAPGRLDAEIDALQSLDGLTTWKRRPKESEQAFKDRASREACKAAGVTLLVSVMLTWTRTDDVGV